jgi:LmbE family N-acetylglucosaminyl deacetylase
VLRKGMLWGIFLLCLMQICGNGSANSSNLQSSVIAGLQNTKHLIVVAHQDDDLLFMNPDIWNYIKAGHALETVYTTAGDRDRPDKYWLGREAGMRATYAYMANATNDWTAERINLADHQLVRFVLKQNPKIRLVFLRLPDGLDIRRWEVTLRTIWKYNQVLIYSKDHQNLYRQGELVQVLKALMDEFQPDAVAYLYPGDHVDHYYTAKFAERAEHAYRKEHIVIRYRDYNIDKSPSNLNAFDSHLKWKIVQIYAKHDEFFPRWGIERTYHRYYSWCQRQYYYVDQFMGGVQRKNPLDSMLRLTPPLD